MNLFQRYQFVTYFNETGKRGLPHEASKDQLSEEAYELESLSKEGKVIAKRMWAHFGL